jgi:hypothetical protein
LSWASTGAVAISDMAAASSTRRGNGMASSRLLRAA